NAGQDAQNINPLIPPPPLQPAAAVVQNVLPEPVNVVNVQTCQATQQQLMLLQPALNILSLCPVCNVMLARHANEMLLGPNAGLQVVHGINVAPPAAGQAVPVAREPDPMKIHTTLEGIAKSFPKWNTSKVPVVYLRS